MWICRNVYVLKLLIRIILPSLASDDSFEKLLDEAINEGNKDIEGATPASPTSVHRRSASVK